MLDHLALHQSSKATLQAVASRPPQGILFTGPVGIGKMSVATALASSLVQHPTSIRIISPDEKGSIAIETIRELYKAFRSKRDGRQVIIIERAELMSLEAQNALLKLLEEPRDGLTFMLTCLHVESLLPTILSRIQHLALSPLPDESIRRLIVSKRPGVAQSDLTQLVFLAQGRPGIALHLLEQGALDSQREHMQLVKQLIGAKPHERYMLAGKLSGSREGALETLGSMAHVAELQLNSARSAEQARHWSRLADALEDAMDCIAHNGNIRAQLLYLFSRY